MGSRCELTNWGWKAVPFSRSCDRESTIAKLQICAKCSKLRVDDRIPLDLEAEHGVTMDGMYDGEVQEWM